MSKETSPQKMKLIDAITRAYPNATEILVSFPDEWELIRQIQHVDTSFYIAYIAAMPKRQEKPRKDEFHGLPHEINLQFNTYRMYRLFEPWPMPTVLVSGDDTFDRGLVEGQGDLKIQLNLLGQALACLGQTTAVLWEAYLNEPAKVRHGQDHIYPFWSAIEDDIGVHKIFTKPYEPTWGEGYADFLRRLGYAPDSNFSGWWSKENELYDSESRSQRQRRQI